MKNWTVRQRILWSFGVIVGLIAVMGGLVVAEMRSISGAVGSLEKDAVGGLFYVAQIHRAAATRFGLAGDYLSKQSPVARGEAAGRLRAEHAAVNEAMQRFEPTIFQARERELFARLKTAVAAYGAAETKMLEAGTTGQLDQAADIMARELSSQFVQLDEVLKRLIDDNKAVADQGIGDINDSISTASSVILVSFAATLAIAVGGGLLLLRSVTTPLRQLVGAAEVMGRGDFTGNVTIDRGDEFGALAQGFTRMSGELANLVTEAQKSTLVVATSITEIGATAREQQATANEVAATSTEIGATAKEISATARDLAQTVGHVTTNAQQTATLADSGRESLNRMQETMRRVTDAAAGINSRLTVLNDKAGNIGSVVTTIAKVADQTNLLSLNAAIEAEKAGEHGRGFSVVATEIRRLADQTAAATIDIEQLVKEIQSAVTAGVMGMDKFSEEVGRGVTEVEKVAGQLGQIIENVQAISPRIRAVSEGMEAQSTGAEQISEALVQLGEAARQTAESLRQSNDTVRSLEEASRRLRSSIERFKVNG